MAYIIKLYPSLTVTWGKGGPADHVTTVAARKKEFPSLGTEKCSFLIEFSVGPRHFYVLVLLTNIEAGRFCVFSRFYSNSVCSDVLKYFFLNVYCLCV